MIVVLWCHVGRHQRQHGGHPAFIIQRPPLRVARGLPDEEIEANCNLIAAAPDLLAALIAWQDAENNSATTAQRLRAHDAAAKMRDAAIARALGKTP